MSLMKIYQEEEKKREPNQQKLATLEQQNQKLLELNETLDNENKTLNDKNKTLNQRLLEENQKNSELQQEKETLQLQLQQQRSWINVEKNQKADKPVKEKQQKLIAFAKNEALVVGLSVYCFVMTMIWLVDRWNIIATVPQWFRNRLDNGETVWAAIEDAQTWLYGLLQPHMSDFIASTIPFVLVTGIVAIIGYFGVKIGISFLLEKWSALWSYYDCRNVKLIKISTTIAIITVNIPIAVSIVGYGITMLNVVSWWLILSLVMNVVYHRITYNQ